MGKPEIALDTGNDISPSNDIPSSINDLLDISPDERQRSELASMLHTLRQDFQPLREESLRIVEVKTTLSRRTSFEPLILRALVKIQAGLSKLLEQQTQSAEDAENSQEIYNAMVYDLNSSKYSLSTPVQVVIVEESDETVAKVPELNLYAVGDSATEAIYELKQEIVDLYEDLTQTDNKLGPLPESWLKTLRKLIVV
ncbi:MAG: hypothetical protein A2Z28_03740 [Chloroflexi bacterium RBG_16_51_9]|nr:MAG: hypothetical protein A2Z28_03740 [Chloroflexi bacterium RBG_16_51_9]